MTRLPLALSVLTLAALATIVFAAGAAAQSDHPEGFKSCGDTENLVLVFMNPDLNVREDGYIHASGRFFIQFQARGPKAMDIDKLYFSFGKPVPGSPAVCDAPTEWYTEGAFLKNYRGDFDWRDGFFVPINTYNVVDGEYIAALSAYDAAGIELVRYWTVAKVVNGCSMQPCEREEYVVNDKVQPWPMLLPGDGVRLDGRAGLYIEVAEPVKEIKAWMGTHDGQALLQLTEIEAPARDDDVLPDVPNNPAGPSTLACPAQLPAQCAKRWGPAWEWAGVVGDEAVIRVRIVDMNDNVAEKVVHVGDPTIGGRVSAGNPELQFELDAPEKGTDADGRAVWNITYRSLNEDGVHGDVFIRNPDGTAVASPFSARVQPNHIMMGGMEQRTGTVTIIAGPNAQPGSYEFHLVVNYLAASQRVEKSTVLKLQVTERSSGNPDDETRFASTAGEQVEATRGERIQQTAPVVVPEETPQTTPGPAALLLVAGAAVAAAFHGRRRRA